MSCFAFAIKRMYIGTNPKFIGKPQYFCGRERNTIAFTTFLPKADLFNVEEEAEEYLENSWELKSENCTIAKIEIKDVEYK